jgi:hypothetical protein
MQVSAEQTTRVLDALRSRPRPARRRRAVGPARGVAPTTIDRAMARVAAQPRVRAGRVSAARARVHAGDHPVPEAVAESVLRRSICDRLS